MILIEKFNELDKFHVDLHKDFQLWDNLIERIPEKELELYHLKQIRDAKEQEIISTTDFKGLYGANNEKVRKNHLKKALSSTYEEIKTLTLEIETDKRTLDFLKAIIKVKTEVIKYDKN